MATIPNTIMINIEDRFRHVIFDTAEEAALKALSDAKHDNMTPEVKARVMRSLRIMWAFSVRRGEPLMVAGLLQDFTIPEDAPFEVKTARSVLLQYKSVAVTVAQDIAVDVTQKVGAFVADMLGKMGAAFVKTVAASVVLG